MIHIRNTVETLGENVEIYSVEESTSENFIMINALLMIISIIHAGYSMKTGSSMAPGEFNYIASIHRGMSHYCTGVIVNEKHIITVAHKIAGTNVGHLRVLVGKKVMYHRYTEQHFIREVYFHPGFTIRNLIEENIYYEHDIAVLRLEESLVWTDSISQVSLEDIGYDLGYCLECILISWILPGDYRHPLILKWELINFMGKEVYQQWASYLGKDQKFFSDLFGTAAIGTEDLGSPLVCGNSMTGMVVQGEQLTIPEKPSIVMSTAPYLEFIDDVVHDGLFEVEWGEFPYVASLWYDGIRVCGGFIIDTTHVATAGHCVMPYKMGDSNVSVGYPPQWFSVVGFAIHPNYTIKTTNVLPKWYIDNDFALLTLEKPILWSQWTGPLPLAESNNFHKGQSCKILRWKHYRDGEKLMTSRVIITNDEYSQSQLNSILQSQVPSFWGKSQYFTSIADHRDAGNPIICDGSPVGFLIQAIPSNGKSTAVLARFHQIRPYIEFTNRS